MGREIGDREGVGTGDREITRLLGAIHEGDSSAWERLASLVYERLRALARGQLAGRLPGATLTPTVVVHEAYLKLVNQRQADWRDRQHFLAVAATAMRQIVVDHARKKRAQKRGGGAPHTSIDGSKLGIDVDTVDVIALDEALEKLSRLDERLTRTVELRYFGGLTVQETAEVLAVSPRTVKSDWRKSRALLYRFLRGTAE